MLYHVLGWVYFYDRIDMPCASGLDFGILFSRSAAPGRKLHAGGNHKGEHELDDDEDDNDKHDGSAGGGGGGGGGAPMPGNGVNDLTPRFINEAGTGVVVGGAPGQPIIDPYDSKKIQGVSNGGGGGVGSDEMKDGGNGDGDDDENKNDDEDGGEVSSNVNSSDDDDDEDSSTGTVSPAKKKKTGPPTPKVEKMKRFGRQFASKAAMVARSAADGAKARAQATAIRVQKEVLQ
jgi:hypothetical protein